MDWDEDEIVPSTQFSEQLPSCSSIQCTPLKGSVCLLEIHPTPPQTSSHIDGSMHSSQTTTFPAASYVDGPSSQLNHVTHLHQTQSSLEPCAVRTPLSTVTNRTLSQAAGKKGSQGSQSKKGKKASPASASKIATPQPILSSDTKAASVTTMPMPSSINLPSQETAPAGDKPVLPQLFFRSGHWTLKETVTLLDGRVKLLEEIRDGNLGAILKMQDERWDFISKYCVQQWVLRSRDQCLFCWDRILATFKKINDYERHIPSGGESYWTMSPKQRDEMKLPRSFTEDVYTAMLDRIGSERFINPGNILYDTSKDILGDSSTSPDKTTNPKKEETVVEEGSSGKKRKRGDKMAILKKELEGTTKQLLALMEGIDYKRTKHDDDIIELTRAEFEESVALNRRRLALEEQSNEALKQIADAFKCFAMHASSPSLGKESTPL
ncbi:hypothetical protein L7F22_063989 [Adiantum nelumboides]|nr:hypothetical protein [Adiantum nelumboides]